MHDGQNLPDASITWNGQEWGDEMILKDLKSPSFTFWPNKHMER